MAFEVLWYEGLLLASAHKFYSKHVVRKINKLLASNVDNLTNARCEAGKQSSKDTHLLQVFSFQSFRRKWNSALLHITQLNFQTNN